MCGICLLLLPNHSGCQALEDKEIGALRNIRDGITRRGPDDFSSARVIVCDVDVM